MTEISAVAAPPRSAGQFLDQIDPSGDLSLASGLSSECARAQPGFDLWKEAHPVADPGTREKLEVYLHEHGDLLAAACAIVGSPHVAEDLVQDCWLRWSARDYRTDQARPILLRIVKNLAIDWHRRRRVEFETLEAHRVLQESPHDAERIIEGRQRLKLVIKALETLPPRTLLAFRYSRVEGMTLKEAGRKLEVSESRVSQLVSDAILRILTVVDA